MIEIEPLFKDYVDFDTFSKSDFRVVEILDCVPVEKSKKLLKNMMLRYKRQLKHLKKQNRHYYL